MKGKQMNLWKYYDGDLKYPNITKHKHEKEIANAIPKWAFKYVLKHGKDEELEPIIAKDTECSFEYADEILNGPFPLGEPAIAKDAFYAVNYARDVLNGDRFKLGEKTIASSAPFSYAYALDVLKGPFKLGEPAIAKDDFYSKKYTNEVLKKDFYLDGKLICKYKG